MDMACHRCGAIIAEGTAFCPQCGAAQIRVSPAAAPSAPPPSAYQQMPAEPLLPADTRVDWSVGFRVAALAGIIAAVPSALPLVSLGCCLWVMGAGALAVMFYQKKRLPGAVVTAGMGVRLGAVSGLFAFVFYFVLQLASIAATGGRGKIREAMLEGMKQSAARNPDPNAQQMLEKLSTPEGLAILLTFMIVAGLFAFIVFGVIGGAVGASIWGRKQQS
jgi:hypothetical protein